MTTIEQKIKEYPHHFDPKTLALYREALNGVNSADHKHTQYCNCDKKNDLTPVIRSLYGQDTICMYITGQNSQGQYYSDVVCSPKHSKPKSWW